MAMNDEIDPKDKKNENDSDALNPLAEIIDNQDIDQLIELIKLSRRGNNAEILNFDPQYVEQHENGIEMFLRTAIKLEPSNPSHHYNYALFLESQHSYELAKEEFETAITLDEGNERYRSDYANLLFMLEDYLGAEKQYKTAIGLNPDNVQVWTNLGRLYFEKNEVLKAEKALKRAINVDPKFPLSYLNLLQLYENQGLKNKAQVVWKKYKNINENIMDLNNLKLDEHKATTKKR
ncbi:tetratricopeptide repeat protein [[Eubacterium] cellulosolvens]